MTETASLTIEELERTIKAIEAEERPSAIPQTPPQLDPQAPRSTPSPLALNEFVDPDQLKRDVEFDLNDLDNAIRSHAALFVHYANLSRLARRQFERMKATAEILESKLYAVHREALLAAGGKATEATIDAAVKCDPRWFATQQKVIDSRAIYDLAGDAREAFAQRKDMLIQISVDRRVERQGEIRIGAAKSAVEEARGDVLAHIAQQNAAAAVK